MKLSERTEVEEFILNEFFEGKSVNKLVSDYLLTHIGNRRQAERLIYKILCEHVNNY